MDGYEATRIVLSRIQSLDPENASKIMGLLLLQDHGEKEMIRLAFGPETLVHSVIAKAKKELGLMSSSRPTWSGLHGQEELISPKNRSSTLNPASVPFYANGRSPRDVTNDFELLDDVNTRGDFVASMHGRSGSCVLDGLGYGDSDLGFVGVPCSYFARGFCKNGGSCRFVHSGGDGGATGVGSPSRFEVMNKCGELLRSNSVPPRLAHQFISRSCLPFSPKGVSLQQSEAQRAAALMMGEDLHRLGRWRPDRIDLSAMACPASRQIYLTFPADSRFREEDVSNYFSTFGPVQDVRIPYQQKRMFGFVTFVYPETVKSILAKGNPHFVCDSRVLVKPYKEKGKVPDKYRTNQTMELDLSPTGLDSSPRDVTDIHFGRGFYNNTQDLLWRNKFEEEVLELQSRRLMNLQLLDVKKHFQQNSPTQIHSPNPFSQRIASPRPASRSLENNAMKVVEGMMNREFIGEKGKGSSKEGSDDDTMNLPERLEDSLPDSPFASPTDHLFLFAESADNNGSDSWSPSDNDDSTPTPSFSDSINSFNCQLPRLPPIGMFPGRGGPTCRVGI